MIMGVDPKLELQFSLSGLHVLVLIAAPKKQRHPMSVSGLQINCSTDRKWWVVAKVTDDESLPGLGPIPAFEHVQHNIFDHAVACEVCGDPNWFVMLRRSMEQVHLITTTKGGYAVEASRLAFAQDADGFLCCPKQHDVAVGAWAVLPASVAEPIMARQTQRHEDVQPSCTTARRQVIELQTARGEVQRKIAITIAKRDEAKRLEKHFKALSKEEDMKVPSLLAERKRRTVALRDCGLLQTGASAYESSDTEDEPRSVSSQDIGPSDDEANEYEFKRRRTRLKRVDDGADDSDDLGCSVGQSDDASSPAEEKELQEEEAVQQEVEQEEEAVEQEAVDDEVEGGAMLTPVEEVKQEEEAVEQKGEAVPEEEKELQEEHGVDDEGEEEEEEAMQLQASEEQPTPPLELLRVAFIECIAALLPTVSSKLDKEFATFLNENTTRSVYEVAGDCRKYLEYAKNESVQAELQRHCTDFLDYVRSFDQWTSTPDDGESLSDPTTSLSNPTTAVASASCNAKAVWPDSIGKLLSMMEDGFGLWEVAPKGCAYPALKARWKLCQESSSELVRNLQAKPVKGDPLPPGYTISFLPKGFLGALTGAFHAVDVLTRARLASSGLHFKSIPFKANGKLGELLVGEDAISARLHVLRQLRSNQESLFAFERLQNGETTCTQHSWEMLQNTLFASGFSHCLMSGMPVLNLNECTEQQTRAIWNVLEGLAHELKCDIGRSKLHELQADLDNLRNLLARRRHCLRVAPQGCLVFFMVCFRRCLIRPARPF